MKKSTFSLNGEYWRRLALVYNVTVKLTENFALEFCLCIEHNVRRTVAEQKTGKNLQQMLVQGK